MGMTLDHFRALLAAWGGEPSRWPEADRMAADALLAREPEARRLREEAAALDAALAFDVAPPAPGLAERVLAAAALPGTRATPPARQPGARDRRSPAGSGWLAALWRELGGLRIAGPALATALVLGVALAELRSGGPAALETDAEALVAEALLAGGYEEFVL